VELRHVVDTGVGAAVGVGPVIGKGQGLRCCRLELRAAINFTPRCTSANAQFAKVFWFFFFKKERISNAPLFEKRSKNFFC
jgi:hypothetical protein